MVPLKIGKNTLRFDYVLALLLVLALAFNLSGKQNIYNNMKMYVNFWLGEHGYRKKYSNGSLVEHIIKVFQDQNLSTSGVPLPQLVLDIKFKNYKKLQDMRKHTLATGYSLPEDKIEVKAKIRTIDDTFKATIRLKGDLNGHRSHKNKWSYRIKIKNQGYFQNLKNFSIMHPRTRFYQFEPVALEFFKHLNILGPRFFFANTTLNGDDLGIMAVEESFSKELLEFQGRREGIILKIDEDLLWRSNLFDGNVLENPFFSFKNTFITSYGKKQIRKSPKLQSDKKVATGLLRGFIEGKLSASQVFDVDLVGKFMAASELWGVVHPLEYRNIRFYFNPVSFRLEPIVYDIAVGFRTPNDELINRSPLFKQLLEDPVIFSIYLSEIRRMTTEMLTGKTRTQFEPYENALLQQLRKEFYLVDNMFWDEYILRSEFLSSLRDEDFALKKMVPTKRKNWSGNYPILAHAYLIKDDTGQYLELSNAIQENIVIESIEWRNLEAGTTQSFTAENSKIEFAGTPLLAVPQTTKIYFFDKPQSTAPLSLVISAHILGEPKIYETIAKPYIAPLARHPLSATTIEEQLVLHPFLTLKPNTRTVTIAQGSWLVTEPIFIPAGYHLIIEPGAHLNFASTASLISYSAITAKGTQQDPIILDGIIGETGVAQWQGLAVMKPKDPCVLTYVSIKNTSGIKQGEWELSGGTTFYQALVEIHNTHFQNNTAEDALNFIETKFNFIQSVISDTTSDAIDADFSNGQITKGRFTNIGYKGGGDGVDLSGSQVNIKNTTFHEVRDKALSVGEESALIAEDIIIIDSGFGLVSKDGSISTVSNITVSNPIFASMLAYIKKPQYGPAQIIATNVQTSAGQTSIHAQTGSVIKINGTEIETEEINVDQLYNTVMNKRAIN